ncbi:MAG: hypothetical protein AAFX99_24515, partial [Myxococcota bacterium]
AFGELPTPTTSSHLRIETHLHYIEEHLRAKPTPDLTPDQRARRLSMLDRLHAYHSKDEGFPVNDDHPDPRRPTFISDNGQVCAVGALMDRAMVEAINQDYKYHLLKDIHKPELTAWAEHNGFTIAELSMIQPSYDTRPESLYCSSCNFDLAPPKVTAYRAEVSKRLRASRKLAACAPSAGKSLTIDFDIAHSGQAYRIRSTQASACVRRALRTIRFPESCGAASRSMQVVLAGDAATAPQVAYAISPLAQGAHSLCAAYDNHNAKLLRGWSEGEAF